VPGGARVDGRRLATSLIAGVRHHGGRSVRGVVAIDGHRVTVDGDPIPADRTVIAAGAWTSPLVASTRIGVAAQRGQICHLQLQDTPTGAWPSVLPPSDHYIVPFDDGRVVVGATREVGVGDPRVTAEGVRSVLAKALELAPGLGEATLTETRVGLRPFPATDHRPTIGRIDERTWVVTGFGAIGLTIGPTVGDRVAEQLLGAPDDPLIAPFAPHSR
jgi:D-amino-acid dehydrogenase